MSGNFEERLTKLEEMDSKAIRSIDRVLQDLAEGQRANTKLIQAVAETQAEHTKTLAAHGEILASHTETLAAHGEILASHGEILAAQTDALGRIEESVGGLREQMESFNVRMNSTGRRLITIDSKIGKLGPPQQRPAD